MNFYRNNLSLYKVYLTKVSIPHDNLVIVILLFYFYSAVSGVAAEMNANLNGVGIDVSSTNLLKESLDKIPAFDVILIGDLCYDSDFSKVLFEFLLKMRGDRVTEIIVGDPGRHGLTNEILMHLQPLKQYELTESGCEENHGFGVVQVFRFK